MDVERVPPCDEGRHGWDLARHCGHNLVADPQEFVEAALHHIAVGLARIPNLVVEVVDQCRVHLCRISVPILERLEVAHMANGEQARVDRAHDEHEHPALLAAALGQALDHGYRNSEYHRGDADAQVELLVVPRGVSVSVHASLEFPTHPIGAAMGGRRPALAPSGQAYLRGARRMGHLIRGADIAIAVLLLTKSLLSTKLVSVLLGLGGRHLVVRHGLRRPPRVWVWWCR